jgi:hypothetical protein
MALRESRDSRSVGNGLLLVFDNETGQPIFDDFGHGPSIESDHRRAAGHCFNQHQAERLGSGDRRQQRDGADTDLAWRRTSQMRDAVTICDPSELAFAQGRDGPLTLCCGETSSFNASAIMAVQNARTSDDAA